MALFGHGFRLGFISAPPVIVSIQLAGEKSLAGGPSKAMRPDAWRPRLGLRGAQGLVEVGYDIRDVFDADRDADHVWRHAGVELFYV